MSLIHLSAALACGGLFCDSASVPTSVTVPVQQTEEAVVFQVDPVADSTTMHVQISYEGPVNEFAWILPVAGEPELDRSTQRLFDALAAQTQERWSHTARIDDSCYDPPPSDWGLEGDSDADTDTDSDTDTDTDSDADGPPPVTVVSSQAVGPYATVVLTATDSGALLQWLWDNGYQVPAGIEPLLAPYIAPGMHFVALKLSKDNDAGDLEPLALTLPGTTPSIPMQLTAVAAADDMPLSVYLLGPDRSLSTNYLHVERNLARAIWPAANGVDFVGNQPTLTAAAVDAAGGRAFATLFSGAPPPDLAIPDLDGLASATVYASTDPIDGLEVWIGALAQLNLALTSQELDFVIPLPEDFGISSEDFFACVSCYPDQLAGVDFDAIESFRRFEERVIEPMEAANTLFDSAVLTRLSTALSAEEMTVDPQFAFVPGLGTVGTVHQLHADTDCEREGFRGGNRLMRTPMQLTLDGRTFMGPNREQLADRDMDLRDWLRDFYSGPALLVQGWEDGELVTLADNRDQLPPTVLAGGDRSPACGCDQSSTGLMASFIPLLLLLLRRRTGRV